MEFGLCCLRFKLCTEKLEGFDVWLTLILDTHLITGKDIKRRVNSPTNTLT